MPEHRPLRRGDPARLSAYQLIGRLGEGGQGVVYLGETPDGALVAVKVLQASLADDDQARRRFLREAAVARRVAGFCTARVLDVGLADERLYIVSEFIDGVSLHRQVAEGGPLEEGGLHRLAVGTAAALAAIHRADIVHRDFKPGNVLLGPDGPRVVDFGIARALDASTTLSNAVLGTPAYMSPEQVSGATVGPASDVFSWATTVVFAATGEPAFGRDSIPAVLHRILHDQPDLSALPESLRPLIARCLAKRPSQRPEAAQILLTLLGYDGAAGTATVEERLLQEGATVAASANTATVRPALASTATTRPAGARSAPAATRPDPVVEPTPADATAAVPVRRRRRWPVWVAVGVLAIAAAVAVPILLQGDEPSDTFGSPIGKPLKGQRTIVSLAVGRLNGRVIAVSGGTFGEETLRVWDLAAGEQIGEPLDMHRGFFEDEGELSVAVGEVNGRAVAVSGSNTSQLVSTDRTVRVWDLATHQQTYRMSGHTSSVSAVAVGTWGGRTIAVSGGLDKTLRVWDLAAGKQLGAPLTGHTAKVNAVAIGQLGDRTVAVSASDDATVRVWDLSTGKQRGAPLTGHTDRVTSVALGEMGGRTIAVTGGSSDDRTVRVWDLATGKAIGKPLTGHTGWVGGVAVDRQGGRTVAVSGGIDQTVRAWDLATGEPIGAPFTGHDAGVTAVAVTELGGRHVAVSGSDDGTVRLWNLQLPSRSPSGGP